MSPANLGHGLRTLGDLGQLSLVFVAVDVELHKIVFYILYSDYFGLIAFGGVGYALTSKLLLGLSHGGLCLLWSLSLALGRVGALLGLWS